MGGSIINTRTPNNDPLDVHLSASDQSSAEWFIAGLFPQTNAERTPGAKRRTATNWHFQKDSGARRKRSVRFSFFSRPQLQFTVLIFFCFSSEKQKTAGTLRGRLIRTNPIRAAKVGALWALVAGQDLGKGGEQNVWEERKIKPFLYMERNKQKSDHEKMLNWSKLVEEPKGHRRAEVRTQQILNRTNVSKTY